MRHVGRCETLHAILFLTLNTNLIHVAMVRMLPTTALFVLAWQKLRWAVISYVSAGTTLSCKALPRISKQRHLHHRLWDTVKLSGYNNY